MNENLIILFAESFVTGGIYLVGVVTIGIWLLRKVFPLIETKKKMIYILALALDLWLTTVTMVQYQNPEPTPVETKKDETGLFNKQENIVGSWIEAGTNYPEKMGHYEFFENGEFQYNIGTGLCVIAKGDEEKEISHQGRWKVENNRSLVLTTLSKTVLNNGARAIEKGDCGTKEQRISAVIKKVFLTEDEKTVFVRATEECLPDDFIAGCEMYTNKGERIVRRGFGPVMTEYLRAEPEQPLTFGSYKINLPKGWGWQEKVEGVVVEGPGEIYCDDTSNLAKDFETKNLKKCNYSIIKDLSENCPNCPRIRIADVKGLTMGGGGYITTVDEYKKLGGGKYVTNYHISWEGRLPETEDGVPTKKMVDENGNPRLYYVEGCPRNDLCVYFNNTNDNKWQYEKIRDFINQIMVSDYARKDSALIFEGEWEYRNTVTDKDGKITDENVYFLQLQQNVYGEDVAGTHCFIINMGNKTDCNRIVTVTGKVTGNKAAIVLTSAFSIDGPIAAELEVNGKLMTFTTKTPNEVVPEKIVLTKIK